MAVSSELASKDFGSLVGGPLIATMYRSTDALKVVHHHCQTFSATKRTEKIKAKKIKY